MSGIRLLKQARELSQRFNAISLASRSGDFFVPGGNFADNSGQSKRDVPILQTFNLSKNHELQLTAKFWSQQTKPLKEIIDPVSIVPLGHPIDENPTATPPTPSSPLPKNSPIEDPAAEPIVEKQAHRLLRIKKRKMKVHRRKKRWAKHWVMWRKQMVYREKKREIAFRQKLIAKVNEAQKFDANKYVEDYLEDMKYELVPQTYKGKRFPKFLMKEVLEQEKEKKERLHKNNTNLLTGKPLTLKNESVASFLERHSK